MREETVPFSNLALSCWLAPRAGSFIKICDEDGDDGAGDGGDDEGPAPAVVFAHGAADDVAECGADEESDVEDGEDAVALIFGVEVA